MARHREASVGGRAAADIVAPASCRRISGLACVGKKKRKPVASVRALSAQSQKRRQDAGATFGNGEIIRSEVEGPPVSVRCALREDAVLEWL